MIGHDLPNVEHFAWKSKVQSDDSHEFQMLRPLKTRNSEIILGEPMTIRWHNTGIDSNLTNYLIDRGELNITLEANHQCQN